MHGRVDQVARRLWPWQEITRPAARQPHPIVKREAIRENQDRGIGQLPGQFGDQVEIASRGEVDQNHGWPRLTGVRPIIRLTTYHAQVNPAGCGFRVQAGRQVGIGADHQQREAATRGGRIDRRWTGIFPSRFTFQLTAQLDRQVGQTQRVRVFQRGGAAEHQLDIACQSRPGREPKRAGGSGHLVRFPLRLMP